MRRRDSPAERDRDGARPGGDLNIKPTRSNDQPIDIAGVQKRLPEGAHDTTNSTEEKKSLERGKKRGLKRKDRNRPRQFSRTAGGIMGRQPACPDTLEDLTEGGVNSNRKMGPSGKDPIAMERDTPTIHPLNQEAVVPQIVDGMTQTAQEPLEMETMALKNVVVPVVHVRLVQTTRVPAYRWVVAEIEAESELSTGPVVFQPESDAELVWGVYLEHSLLEPGSNGSLRIPVANRTGFTQVIEAGVTLGGVAMASVINAEQQTGEVARVLAATVDPSKASHHEKFRQEKLKEAVGELDLSAEGKEAFQTFIAKHHQAFCLEDSERGETDLVSMHVDTGDTHPIKQRVRRMPFALRQEVARQLHNMQESGVIQPSNSSWASPAVLVRKRDGSHRFCVDYRRLNASRTLIHCPE